MYIYINLLFISQCSSFFQFTDGDDSENAEERERRCNRQREALIQFKEDSSSDAVVDNVTTTTTGVCGSRLQGI